MTMQTEINKMSETSQQFVSIWGKCPFLKLIKKIWNVVKSIFYYIKNIIFPPKFKQLTSDDIEFLQRAKQNIRTFADGDSSDSSDDLNRRNISNHTQLNTTHSDTIIDEAGKQNLLDDPTYRKFYDASVNFIHQASQIVCEDMIDPEIPEIKRQISNLHKHLIKGADVVISLGSKLTSPLDEKLANFIPTDIIHDDMKQLLEWLTDGKNSKKIDSISEKVFLNLKEKIKQDNLNFAIGICIRWIFETDHKKPLLTSSIPFFSDKSVVELVFKEFIVILSERKIKEFDEKIQKNLNANLEEVVRSMLITNVEKLGKIVLERLICVIDEMPFSKMMDDFLRLLVDQSSAIIAAEKAKESKIEAESKRIQYYKKANQETEVQNDPEQEKLHLHYRECYEAYRQEVKRLWIETYAEQAKDFAIKNGKINLKTYNETGTENSEINLEMINRVGAQEWLRYVGEQAKEESINELNEKYDTIYCSDDQNLIQEFENELLDLWLKNMGDDASSHVYKSFLTNGSPLCHPNIDELELVESNTLFKSNFQQSKEESGEFDLGAVIDRLAKILPVILNLETNQSETLFADIADRLTTLLFPDLDLQLNNSSNDDGLVYLLGQLKYPQELIELYKEADFIYSHVLTDQRQKEIVNILKKNSQIIKTCLLRYLKYTIKISVTRFISSHFQKFIVQEKIDHLFAFTALPNIQMLIVKNFLLSIIKANYHSYIDSFVTIIKANSEDERNQAKEEFINILNKKLCSHLNISDDIVEDETLRDSYHLDKININQLVVKQIDELILMINGVLATHENRDELDIHSFISETIEVYLSNEIPDTNPLFGELFDNYAFKMGKFSWLAEKGKGWFIDKIAAAMTQSTNNIQKSPHFLLGKAEEFLSESFSEPQQMRDFLSKEPGEIDPKATNDKLQNELTKTAKIAHDYLIYMIKQESFFIRKPLQWFVISSNYSQIDQMIKRIYRQFFGNPLYAQNLAVRMQEIISKALKEGAESPVFKMNYNPSLIEI